MQYSLPIGIAGGFFSPISNKLGILIQNLHESKWPIPSKFNWGQTGIELKCRDAYSNLAINVRVQSVINENLANVLKGGYKCKEH